MYRTLFIFFLIITALNLSHASDGQNRSGQLYLTNWALTSFQPVVLDDGWRDVTGVIPSRINSWLLPSWNREEIKSNLTIMELTVIVPDSHPYLSLKIPRTFTSKLLYLNGNLLVTNELDENNTTIQRNFTTVLIHPQTSRMNFRLIIYNRSKTHSQPWKGIFIGERRKINSIRESKLITTSILIGIFLFIFIFNLSRAFIFARDKTLSLLTLSFVCLSGFFFTLLTGSTLDLFIMVRWEILLRVLITVFNLVFLLIGIFLIVFQPKPVFKTVCATFIGLGVVLSIIGLISDPGHLNIIILTIYAFYALFMLTITAMFIVEAVKSNRRAILYAISILIVLGAMLLDYLKFISNLEINFWLPFGLCLFSILYSFLFTMNLAKEITLNRSFLEESERLKSMEKDLQRKKEILDESEKEFYNMKESVRKRKAEFLANFTEREKEIIDLLLAGDSYNDMAEKLGISEKTIENHSHHIYRKSKVSGRGQLIKLFNNLNEQRMDD